MRRGEDVLIACPSCGKEYVQETLISGNNYGARYWTDGKRDAPMLPAQPSFTRCDSCKTFFHVDDAEIIADERPLFFSADLFNEENGEDLIESRQEPKSETELEKERIYKQYREAPYIRFLTLTELLECIELQPKVIQERESQIAVRTELLHKKNDYYRYTAPSFEPDLSDNRIVSNMETLAELLIVKTDEKDSNSMMLRAELLRELGRFGEAASALSSIPEEARSIPLFETMNRLIHDGDNRIYEYNADTGMQLSPEEFTSTALTHACSTGDLDLVTFFAERTGQEELNEAFSSLDIYEDQALPVLRILLKEGADINTQDRSGQTLLHKAIEEGLNQTAYELLEMGIDPDRVDVLGNTPLILVAGAITECPDLVSELLKRGTDINHQDKWCNTAYSKAKAMKHTQVMAILSDAGADTTLGPEEEEENSNGMKWI
jgi:hypothetical protein